MSKMLLRRTLFVEGSDLLLRKDSYDILFVNEFRVYCSLFMQILKPSLPHFATQSLFLIKIFQSFGIASTIAIHLKKELDSIPFSTQYLKGFRFLLL